MLASKRCELAPDVDGKLSVARVEVANHGSHGKLISEEKMFQPSRGLGSKRCLQQGNMKWSHDEARSSARLARLFSRQACLIVKI